MTTPGCSPPFTPCARTKPHTHTPASPRPRRQFATTGLRQYKTLLGRELLSITRNPFDVAGRTLTFTWVGILMGILYYGLPVGVGTCLCVTASGLPMRVGPFLHGEATATASLVPCIPVCHCRAECALPATAMHPRDWKPAPDSLTPAARAAAPTWCSRSSPSIA